MLLINIYYQCMIKNKINLIQLNDIEICMSQRQRINSLKSYVKRQNFIFQISERSCDFGKIVGAHFLEAVNYVPFASLRWNRRKNDCMQERRWAILSEGIIIINISVSLYISLAQRFFFHLYLAVLLGNQIILSTNTECCLLSIYQNIRNHPFQIS